MTISNEFGHGWIFLAHIKLLLHLIEHFYLPQNLQGLAEGGGLGGRGGRGAGSGWACAGEEGG